MLYSTNVPQCREDITAHSHVFFLCTVKQKDVQKLRTIITIKCFHLYMVIAENVILRGLMTFLTHNLHCSIFPLTVLQQSRRQILAMCF
jgi:hypothetical protein